MTTATKRGRPRKLAVPMGSNQAPVTARPVEAQRDPNPVPKSSRRRRGSTGGLALKLNAPARPGYVRRWFNDDGNRIADAQELAYEYVHEGGIKSSDAGTRISRLVGTKVNGEPLRAYLMETPDELYAEGVAEREAVNRQVDEAIAAGRDSTGQIPQGEGYGEGSIRRDR